MTTEEPDDERQARVDEMAAHKRYNMKALGRLVDSNRLTGVTRPAGDGPSKRRPDDAEDVDQVDHRVDDRVDDDTAAPGDGASTERVLAIAERMDLPIRLTGSGNGGVPASRLGDEPSEELPDDGVDRSGLGATLTRSGLSLRLEEPRSTDGDEPRSQSSLARQMLDGEIRPGGRISDPRDVPGIVLDLAKDVPASVAVSVVRIDEEVEVVGDSIDPSIDPTLFTSIFSGLFRVVRPAIADLENGPLGTIRDVVVEGERMDLVLRPLGARYFLLVMEDRSDPQANLSATRMRMAWIAPGLSAILAQQDGEV